MSPVSDVFSEARTVIPNRSDLPEHGMFGHVWRHLGLSLWGSGNCCRHLVKSGRDTVKRPAAHTAAPGRRTVWPQISTVWTGRSPALDRRQAEARGVRQGIVAPKIHQESCFESRPLGPSSWRCDFRGSRAGSEMDFMLTSTPGNPK